MKDKAVIYSVNPTDMVVSNGQFGHQPVAGAGNKLYGATKIDGRTLLRDLGNDNFSPLAVGAREIATDICTRYEQDGFFLTEDDAEPTPKQLSEAKAKFREFCTLQARHADSIWDRTHNRELIDERARRAARVLNLRPAWADATPEETQECPYCAETIKARASFCKECKKELPQNVPTKKSS